MFNQTQSLCKNKAVSYIKMLNQPRRQVLIWSALKSAAIGALEIVTDGNVASVKISR